MSAKHVLLIVTILLIAVLAVGLILCRPMEISNYADGPFSLEAVDGAFVWAYEQPGGRNEAEVEPVTVSDQQGLSTLTGFFEGKGFGRDPVSLFSGGEPTATEGDICWGVNMHSSLSGSTLVAEYTGGVLTLTGESSVRVLAQDKDQWARQVYDYIISLYPEPEPEEQDNMEN